MDKSAVIGALIIVGCIAAFAYYQFTKTDELAAIPPPTALAPAPTIDELVAKNAEESLIPLVPTVPVVEPDDDYSKIALEDDTGGQMSDSEKAMLAGQGLRTVRIFLMAEQPTTKSSTIKFILIIHNNDNTVLQLNNMSSNVDFFASKKKILSSQELLSDGIINYPQGCSVIGVTIPLQEELLDVHQIIVVLTNVYEFNMAVIELRDSAGQQMLELEESFGDETGRNVLVMYSDFRDGPLIRKKNRAEAVEAITLEQVPVVYDEPAATYDGPVAQDVQAIELSLETRDQPTVAEQRIFIIPVIIDANGHKLPNDNFITMAKFYTPDGNLLMTHDHNELLDSFYCPAGCSSVQIGYLLKDPTDVRQITIQVDEIGPFSNASFSLYGYALNRLLKGSAINTNVESTEFTIYNGQDDGPLAADLSPNPEILEDIDTIVFGFEDDVNNVQISDIIIYDQDGRKLTMKDICGRWNTNYSSGFYNECYQSSMTLNISRNRPPMLHLRRPVSITAMQMEISVPILAIMTVYLISHITGVIYQIPLLNTPKPLYLFGSDKYPVIVDKNNQPPKTMVALDSQLTYIDDISYVTVTIRYTPADIDRLLGIQIFALQSADGNRVQLFLNRVQAIKGTRYDVVAEIISDKKYLFTTALPAGSDGIVFTAYLAYPTSLARLGVHIITEDPVDIFIVEAVAFDSQAFISASRTFVNPEGPTDLIDFLIHDGVKYVDGVPTQGPVMDKRGFEKLAYLSMENSYNIRKQDGLFDDSPPIVIESSPS